MFHDLKDCELCETLRWLNKIKGRDNLKSLFEEAYRELHKRVPLVAKIYIL